METYFYYIRDENRHPVISVCLIKNKEEVARGAAFCSPSDLLIKKEGRRRALGRAKRAMGLKKSCEVWLTETRTPTKLINLAVDHEIVGHWEFNPNLSNFERKLIKD